jgi:hypothetical protein
VPGLGETTENLRMKQLVFEHVRLRAGNATNVAEAENWNWSYHRMSRLEESPKELRCARESLRASSLQDTWVSRLRLRTNYW